RLDAELRLETLFYPELLEEREVGVPNPRPAESAAARVAEAGNAGTGWLREQARVVVRFSGRSNSADRSRITIEVEEDRSAAPAVNSAVRAADRIRRAGVVGIYAGELPVPEKIACKPVVVFQERQFIEKAQLENMSPVETRRIEVVRVFQRRIPGEPDPSIFVGHVLGVAEGVGSLQQKTVLELPVKRHLQRVVAALCAGHFRNVF